MTVPLLPVTTFISYSKLLHMAPSQRRAPAARGGPLPQYYADMFGWREMAAKVAAIYNALPPEERAKAVFFGRNYGEAAAIDVFGPPLGLPPAVSGHNNYFLWGPQGHDGSVVITLGGKRAELPAGIPGRHGGRPPGQPLRHAVRDEPSDLRARGLKVPFDWSKLKHYE